MLGESYHISGLQVLSGNNHCPIYCEVRVPHSEEVAVDGPLGEGIVGVGKLHVGGVESSDFIGSDRTPQTNLRSLWTCYQLSSKI